MYPGYYFNLWKFLQNILASLLKGRALKMPEQHQDLSNCFFKLDYDSLWYCWSNTEKSDTSWNNGAKSSAFGCASCVDQRETICCLLCAVLMRRAVWGADGKAVSRFWQQPSRLFSQEVSYGIDNGSEKWLPQLEVRLVLAGLSDVPDRLESAITRVYNYRALLERRSHFSSE